jgi:hypothetical protein
MATLYGSDALRAYAREQIERADDVLARHAEAALSLCRCGRVHPCDERRYRQATRTHYAQIIKR